MRHLPWALVALLVLPGIAAPSDAQSSASAPEWWGPTGVGQGHHIRIPVVVSHPAGSEYTADRAPVSLELDLTAILEDAGWSTVERSGRDILRSFELDLDSIRVIEMTNLHPRSAGTSDGRMIMQDEELEGDERFVVPSKVMQGSLERRTDLAFHPTTNPLITVFWHVDGAVGPGQERYYMVYLDSKTNRDHPPAASRPIADAALDGLFASGASREFYGYTPQLAKARITLLGLHDNTQVTLSIRNGDGPFQPRASSLFSPNPVALDADDTAIIVVAAGSAAEFKLTADKPFLAFQTNNGFVPGIHGGFADDTFRFMPPTDRVHFINAIPGNPTQIEIEQGGQVVAGYDLASGQNPYDYSASPYWQGAGAGCPAAGARLNPNQAYTARVTAGGPVLLQTSQPGALSPVPSQVGGPTGDRFLSVLSGVVPGQAGGGCATNVGSWYVMSSSGENGASVTSPERTNSIDQRELAGPFILEGPFNLDGGAVERPLTYEMSTGHGWMYSGVPPNQGATSSAGPFLGADLGREFAAGGPAIVFSPYPGNELSIDAVHTIDASNTEKATITTDQSLRIQGGSSTDQIASFHLRSSKPVFVYPLNIQQNHLAGVPPFLDAEVAAETPPEFRGRLLQLRSTDGNDLLTASTTGDTTMEFSLAVRNLGRDVEGKPLLDTANLFVADHPAGWDVTLSPGSGPGSDSYSVPLFDSSPSPVNVMVHVPADVAPGQVAVVSIGVESKNNPAIQDRVEIRIFVQKNFAVGLWFDFADKGEKFQENITAPDTVSTYKVILKNLGSIEDTFDIRVETSRGAAPGWSSVLFDGGGGVPDSVVLGPGQDTTLVLRTTPPDGLTEDRLITTVTATSRSEPATLDRVTATTKIRSPSELGLEVLRRSDLILPGEEAVFPLLLSNSGEGGTEVRFDIDASLKEGWGPAKLYLLSPVDGSRIPLDLNDTFAVEPAAQVEVYLAVGSPGSALSGDSANLRLQVSSSGDDAQEGFMYAVVGDLHRLEVETPPLPLHASSLPEILQVPLTITNDGNLDEVLTGTAITLPRGWSFDLDPQTVVLPMGTTQVVAARIGLPPGTPAGSHNVDAALVAPDGNTTSIALPVEVGALADVRVEGPSSPLLVQPGQTLRSVLPVNNTGNVPLTVSTVLAATPWEISMAPVTLDVGDRDGLEFVWTVPATAADGAVSRNVTVDLVPTDSGVEPSHRTVEFTFLVGRADLSLELVGIRDAPGGRIVDISVLNLGSRTAREVDVVLLAGTRLADSASFDALPAGSTSPVSLLVPDGLKGPYQVVVDEQDLVIEATELNNVIVVDLDGVKEAPGFGLVGVMLVFAVGGTVRRRLRR